jgi:hypothetical protein
MIPLLIQSLQNDLQARNEYHQSLALVAIGNIGGKEMAESVAPVVQKMLISKYVLLLNLFLITAIGPSDRALRRNLPCVCFVLLGNIQI